MSWITVIIQLAQGITGVSSLYAFLSNALVIALLCFAIALMLELVSRRIAQNKSNNLIAHD